MKQSISLLLVAVFTLTGYGTQTPVAGTDGEGSRNSAAPTDAPVATVKGSSQTFALHGPFAIAKTGASVAPKTDLNIAVEDESQLLKPIARPKSSPQPIINDGGDSTLKAGDIPKVFQGFATGTTGLETRDLQIAASTTNVIVTSSHRISNWTRDGTLVSDLKTSDFYKPAKDDINSVLKDPTDPTKLVSAKFPVSEFYDTRVLFDTYRNRFWIVSLSRNMGPKPSDPTPAQTEQWKHRVTVTSIAVSKTQNPQDGWYTYWMDPCSDYQAIGVSMKLFVVGYSQTDKFGFMSVLNANALSSGQAAQKATTLGGFKNPDGSAATAYMQPALQYGPSYKDMQFFVSNPNDGKNNVVWGLDPANPTQFLQAQVAVAAYVDPKTAEQAGNADIPYPALICPLRAGDMIIKAIFRNNKLYWVWDDSKPGDTRQIRFIRLNRVDMTLFPTYLQFGKGSPAIDRRFGKRTVSDPPNDIFSYYMPALAVNKDGTMVVTYSRSGATIWPQARYSIYFEKDSDIRPSYLLHKGDYPFGSNDPTFLQAPEDRKSIGVFDYNGAAVDPLDDRSVWTVNVYATKQNTGAGQYSLVVNRIPISGAP